MHSYHKTPIFCSALPIAHTIVFQLHPAGEGLPCCFVIPNIFFQKFLTQTPCWPVEDCRILAGCWTIATYLLFSSICMCKKRSVLYRNQKDNTVICSLHTWQYLAAIVKPFSWCCLFFFYVTTALACRCHEKENTAQAALIHEDRFLYSSFIPFSSQWCQNLRHMICLFEKLDNKYVWPENRVFWILVHIKHKHPSTALLGHWQSAFFHTNSLRQWNDSRSPAAYSLKPIYLQFIMIFNHKVDSNINSLAIRSWCWCSSQTLSV